MKGKPTFCIVTFAILGILLMLTSSCKKDKNDTTLKKDPVITWSNPANISYGTLLSTTQLNATADVSGSFVYTPALGTKLSEGAHQDLKVNFTPTDGETYNTITKTVKINVTHVSGSGGVSSAIFNPNLSYGTVTDIDGNVYKTITINMQTWMAENLRTTRYSNGDSISRVTDGAVWANLTTGAYCNYNNTNNSDTIATYGRLYNWYAVNDSRKLAPAGWHVASDAEWTTLTDNLGGESIAGGKLKETGTTHWFSPNEAATNENGFTALPGGIRYTYGKFSEIGNYGNWWSSTHAVSNYALYRTLNFDRGNVYRDFDTNDHGFSVRCVED